MFTQRSTSRRERRSKAATLSLSVPALLNDAADGCVCVLAPGGGIGGAGRWRRQAPACACALAGPRVRIRGREWQPLSSMAAEPTDAAAKMSESRRLRVCSEFAAPICRPWACERPDARPHCCLRAGACAGAKSCRDSRVVASTAPLHVALSRRQEYRHRGGSRRTRSRWSVAQCAGRGRAARGTSVWGPLTRGAILRKSYWYIW